MFSKLAKLLCVTLAMVMVTAGMPMMAFASAPPESWDITEGIGITPYYEGAREARVYLNSSGRALTADLELSLYSGHTATYTVRIQERSSGGGSWTTVASSSTKKTVQYTGRTGYQYRATATVTVKKGSSTVDNISLEDGNISF